MKNVIITRIITSTLEADWVAPPMDIIQTRKNTAKSNFVESGGIGYLPLFRLASQRIEDLFSGIKKNSPTPVLRNRTTFL